MKGRIGFTMLEVAQGTIATLTVLVAQSTIHNQSWKCTWI